MANIRGLGQSIDCEMIDGQRCEPLWNRSQKVHSCLFYISHTKIIAGTTLLQEMYNMHMGEDSSMLDNTKRRAKCAATTNPWAPAYIGHSDTLSNPFPTQDDWTLSYCLY